MNVTGMPFYILVFAILAILMYLIFRLFKRRKQVQTLKRKLSQAHVALEKELICSQEVEAKFNDLKNRYDQEILHDPITQLPSRQVFEDRLQQTLNQSKRHHLIFAILSLSIDDFRMIQNVLGEEIGLQLLQEIVARLNTCLRQVDTLSHVSGSGFLLLLPQLSKAESAAYVAQRLLDEVSRSFHIKNHELFITASVGISIYPADGESCKDLLKNADTALLQAKIRGSNAYQFYQQEMYALSRRELLLNSRLRSDSIFNELVIYYQPLLNVESKEIFCMEALLRWQHPELDLIQPLEFLRLAENNGRIVAIGEWVLRNACLQHQKWKDQGFMPQTISVNVSLRQLENPHFVHKVSQILQETKTDPHALVLEISESILLPKLEMVEKTLHMLKHLGVLIAIDDFGTGYLSLQHLRRFPVHYIKIDGSLIQGITTNKECEAITKMIIVLANSLQLKTIAEGVELAEQKQMLRDQGCLLMQGHLFSRPILPKEFNTVLLKEIQAHA